MIIQDLMALQTLQQEDHKMGCQGSNNEELNWHCY